VQVDPGKPRREWIAITISILALAISGATAFFTIIQQSDDVRLVFPSPPLLPKRADYLLLEKRVGYPLILTNSGNRPVSISSVGLLLIPYEGNLRGVCEGDHIKDAATFATSVSNLVLKEKQIWNDWLHVTGPAFEQSSKILNVKDDPWYRIPLKDNLRSKSTMNVEVCLEVDFSTPSVAYSTKRIRVALLVSTSEGSSYVGGSTVDDGGFRRSHSLIRRWVPIWSD
jgi:hypothetical protein